MIAGKKSGALVVRPFRLLDYVVSDISLATTQRTDWSLNLFGIPQLWRESRGAGVRVAIIDSGIAASHPDLQGAVTLTRDFTGSSSGVDDGVGHGTHVAGIVGARDNAIGVVGVAPACEIIAAKVVGDDGTADPDAVVEAIDWAVSVGANIFSISFGQPEPNDEVYAAIQRSIAAGCMVICAAGNTGPNLNSVLYPAAYPEVICVGSCNQQLLAAPCSARGRELDILAPGEDILSTYPPQLYAMMSGTSMAAPFVAGVAALILSKHRSTPGATPVTTQQELLEHLIQTATDGGPAGFDPTFGYGLINPAALLSRGQQSDLAPIPTPINNPKME